MLAGWKAPKQLLDYGLIGKREPGRPLKRLLDGCNREPETGLLLAWVNDQMKKKKKKCVCERERETDRVTDFTVTAGCRVTVFKFPVLWC